MKSGVDALPQNPIGTDKPSMGELFQTFGKIGLLSFGGPAGQIALMHRVLVEEKGWLEEKQFLHALNFCMLLPGPEAMQLATYAGWLLRGSRGGILAGSLFVIPGFFVLLALSMAYVLAAKQPLVAGLLFGLKAAVLAIVVQALAKVSRRALKSGFAVLVAFIAFVMLAVFHLPFPVVILSAAIVGFFAPALFGAGEEIVPATQGIDGWNHLRSVALWSILLWGLPLVLLVSVLGKTHVFAEEALFFSKTAVVTFGGAYAVLQYVGQQAVQSYHWLNAGEMVTGLGLAETTPGPLILVLEFVGFVGAYRDPGSLPPLLSAVLGALVTVWFTFVPCFIWIFAGAPFMERLRGNGKLQGGFAAITAAVVGVIANLSLWFAMHVLFANIHGGEVLGNAVEYPEFSSFNMIAGLIAITAGLMLWRGKGLFTVLGFAAIAGIAAQLSGLV